MASIQDQFADYFRAWGLTLPSAALAEPTDVVGEGWTIRTVPGRDRRGPYIDMLASHRMTNARHSRFRDDHDVEDLPSYHEFFAWHPDEGPTEEEAQEAYFAHNRRVSEILIAKGLVDPDGDSEVVG